MAEGGGDADVTIKTSREIFEKIIAGEQNPTISYLTGKLKIEGNIEAAIGFERLFD